ncbi:dipeptide/oligopeptide/nickel ABC transporter ATP-binding protein [Candidatus Bathyarchaeota archaeon ex4484_205]|nr:MAG: dipeptide/oligopeptide/nickel ABC transporter ATP-binding protein [Candidatus Bathyarchaeota archaeon ex4484_205]
MDKNGTLLSVQNLYLYYKTRKGLVQAVDDVNMELKRGETLAVVGESGCGKSSLARAIIRLLPRNVGKYSGKIILDNVDTMKLNEEEFRKQVRWKRISMVFQGAQNSLNPVLKVGYQIAEVLMLHLNMSKSRALEEAKKYLRFVGIHEAFVDRYPFELSGGMKQRVMIAMSLITNPDIIILDEPTSALDVITQANIMNLLKKLKKERNFSYIFITHDMALASELADKVAIMYAGEIVEIAPSEVFYSEPMHPYAKGLIGSVPTLRSEKELKSIPGSPPSLFNPPKGCRFHPRCPHADDRCSEKNPPTIELKDGHLVKCWLYVR